VQGLALGLLDPASLAVFDFVPSQGVTSFDEPRVTGASLALVPPEPPEPPPPSDLPLPPPVPVADAEIWLFGGIDATGLPADGLYRGRTVAGTGPDEALLVWERVTSYGPVPPGRAGALLAHDLTGRSLVLFGGFAADRALDDLWRFDLSSNEWRVEQVTGLGSLPPGGRGFMAHAQAGGFVYLYGGRTFDGSLLGDLVILDLAGGSLRVLEQDTGTGAPGPRASASMAIELDGKGLLLYGGEAESGAQNDLWRFDLATRRWERLVPSCVTGPCPGTPTGALLASGPSRTVVLLPGIGFEARPEPVWYFDRARATVPPGWIPYSEWTRSPLASDCDGDGVAEASVGTVCTTSPDWFSPPSVLGCDPRTGEEGCATLATPVLAIHELETLPNASFAARGTTVILAAGHDLTRLSLVPAASPAEIAAERLDGRAVGVVLDGSLALVATTRGIETFSLAGGGLRPLGRRDIAGSVGAIATDGWHLLVAAGRRLLVLDSSSSDLPELGSVELANAAASAMAISAGNVAIAAGGEVVVVSVGDPAAPELIGRIRVGGSTKALRAHGTRVHGVKAGGDTYVVDLSDPAAPTLVGEHDVAEWASGAGFLTGFSVRLDGRSLEVAEIGR
jgi:hypothetical protein